MAHSMDCAEGDRWRSGLLAVPRRSSPPGLTPPGSPGHRGYRGVGTMQQFRRSRVMTVRGYGEAMDEQPRQWQRDGHQ